MPNLDRTERMFWPPSLILNDADKNPVDPQPAATEWEASFDGGANWKDSRAHPDHPEWPCWLIQGPDAGSEVPTDATITGIQDVKIRHTDTPEKVVTTLRIVLI